MDLNQVRPHRLLEIENFFQTYKLLEDKAVEVVGWREGMLLAVSVTMVAATLAGTDANARAWPVESTRKIVPDRSPTSRVPSSSNASPQATTRARKRTERILREFMEPSNGSAMGQG